MPQNNQQSVKTCTQQNKNPKTQSLLLGNIIVSVSVFLVPLKVLFLHQCFYTLLDHLDVRGEPTLELSNGLCVCVCVCVCVSVHTCGVFTTVWSLLLVNSNFKNLCHLLAQVV